MFRFSKYSAVAVVGGLILSAAAWAGSFKGVTVERFSIGPYVRNAHHEWFKGGQEAVIVVEGDGLADLDLFVYDDRGTELARDDDSTNYCVVRFYPSRTQRLKMVVKNCDGIWNTYTLGHN